ncbi:MAG: CoA transferase [Thermoleophilaceae bacterium]
MSALDGVRVLDLSRLLPGGFCSLLLADFGADVLKLEDTGMGDYVRWSPPFHEGAEDSAASALFLALNRGKRSIRVNLREDAGRDVLLRLVREHDVLLESFRPGVLDRLGVGYERLREENPGLVYCAISGYGQDGPLRDRVGHDTNYLALTGLLGLSGEPEGPPAQAAGQIADLGGGALMAAFGILAALRERERSGLGQLVDVSMADGALSWLAMTAASRLAGGPKPERGGTELAGGLACYRPYACRDGGHVALGALEPKFWQELCHGLDREDLLEAQFAPPGSDGPRRARARVPRAHPRGVDRVRRRAPLLPRAGARPRRGPRVGARARPRNGGGARSAGRSHARASARLSREDEPHAGPCPRAGTCARRAHVGGPGRGRLLRGGDRRARGVGRGGGTPGRKARELPGLRSCARPKRHSTGHNLRTRGSSRARGM